MSPNTLRANPLLLSIPVTLCLSQCWPPAQGHLRTSSPQTNSSNGAHPSLSGSLRQLEAHYIRSQFPNCILHNCSQQREAYSSPSHVHLLNSEEVTQISNMNVIPNACAIVSRVVLPENSQFLPLLYDDFLHEREEVVGVLIGLIAQEVGLVGSTRIEVPQRNNPPIFMNTCQATKQHLNTGLGLAIWASWQLVISLFTIVLVSIHSSCRRKDEVLALLVFLHEPKQIHGPNHVVFIVEHGLSVGLADSFLGCEMHDGIDGVVLFPVEFEYALQEFIVKDAPFVELYPSIDVLLAQFQTKNLLDSVQNIVKAVGKIIDNDHTC